MSDDALRLREEADRVKTALGKSFDCIEEVYGYGPMQFPGAKEWVTLTFTSASGMRLTLRSYGQPEADLRQLCQTLQEGMRD